MAAGEFDIVLEEGSNLNFDFTYRDEDGAEVDVSNYGATICFSKDREDSTEPWAEGDHNDGWVQVGDTNGKIIISVPYTAYNDLNEDQERGVWELYIYPTASDITDRPKKLLKGKYKYERSLRSDL